MSWELDNAMKRIFNVFKRFKEQKGKIWDNDIEALKTINLTLENIKEQMAIDNILFLKLLTILFKAELDHFKDINFAKKNIHSALSLPLSHHLEFLRISLNQIDFDNYLKSIGMSNDFLADKETKVNDDKILDARQKEIIEKLKKFWTLEKVEKSMYNTCNEFITDIDNYKID
jgi:hypothetical protein